MSKIPKGPIIVFCAILPIFSFLSANADWPMVRGSAEHAGFVPAELPRSFRLEWVVEFDRERIGTAVEPIVAERMVFIGTHSGLLHAIDSQNGDEVWAFRAGGPILHSAACDRGRVFMGSADGNIYALEAKSGAEVWRYGGPFGGYAAAPIVVGGRVLIGSRSGELVCLDGAKGTLLWRKQLPAPIRQTAAADGSAVFVAGEDLRLRAFDLKTGEERWTSEPMRGQTARDYYPIVVRDGEKSFVIVRTNPLLTMSERIGRDRTVLARNAGFDDSGWQKIDAWIKSDAARGSPELWAREQQAVSDFLRQSPDAQTMYVFEGRSGKTAGIPPVLWVSGCQAVGAQPAQTREGKMLLFYRSAYGNWNHGVAPLVALGLLDLNKNSIVPLFHQQGRQPAWNCFWGTADESQNFVVAGKTVVIAHQGTLSGFDLEKNELFPIHGERDTYGGFRSPAWARNEWHGPGRGGVAIEGQRIYWQTGSRILCLAPGEKNKSTPITTLRSKESAEPPRAGGSALEQQQPSEQQNPGRPIVRVRDEAELKAELVRAVEEWLGGRWAPLFVDPGLSGREFFFTRSGEAFEAGAFAFPHLPQKLQDCLKERLRQELETHPPFLPSGSYSLAEGRAREWFEVPRSYRTRSGRDAEAHPFGNLWQLWAWTISASEYEITYAKWPAMHESYRSFLKTNWKLDPAKGDLYANRYIASLRAFAQMALRNDEENIAREADAAAKAATKALVEWWKRAAQGGTLGAFDGSRELDPFINRGDAISFKVAPHKHKIALFNDLSREVFAENHNALDAVDRVWRTFSEVYKTWPLQGEERQVHFGENFVDTPDLALGAFKMLAWRGEASGADVDLPFCRADLYYIEKLALALE